MAKRRGPKVHFNLNVKEDPSLWRYSDAQAALRANTDILSKLIRTGETTEEQQGESAKAFTMSESA
jgi:hypothetical protein